MLFKTSEISAELDLIQDFAKLIYLYFCFQLFLCVLLNLQNELLLNEVGRKYSLIRFFP